MTREAAEKIGARAVLFLAEDGQRLGRFLAETGLGPAELRASMRAPETLAAVLGHVLANESALLEFAANCGFKPDEIATAEAVLSGGSPWDST
ncbi:MAG: DUF3572 domain-containing protein [Proteobacteria bacterium]|nr:DUF3572 domain-containing protein [Pseudomonadota bacterium]